MILRLIVLFVSLFMLTLFPSETFAGGWTKTGSVYNIETVRSQGFLIKGDLGEKIGCDTALPDALWVGIDHPQYEHLYSTALAAFLSSKKIRAYAHTCTAIGWRGGEFSTLSGAGSLIISE